MIITPLVLDVVSPDLSAEEQQLVYQLQWRLAELQPFNLAHQAYYDGEQPMKNLGIAVPPQLEALRTAAGWPAIVVDSLEERLDVQGFRFPSSLDADSELWDIWMGNGMDHESGLAHLDALVFGRAFLMAGSADRRLADARGDMPLLTVESPMNMSAEFDTASRQVRAALQVYEFWGDEAAALYLPDQTVHLIRPRGGAWRVRDRDQHRLGKCPVVLMANQARTYDRYGKSEITPQIRSWTDAACRTLLGMEIAREFFGSPQRYILGASEEAFQKADGTPMSAWETYIGRVLALERDEEGEVPQVGTFTASDPQPFIAIIKMLAQLVSSQTGLPPHLLGFAADNPASAEAIRSSEARLDKRARRRQRSFECAWRELAQLALMIAGGGSLPADASQLDVLWEPPETPTPGATSTAILAQVQSGALPPTSEVTLEKLGYSATERARIVADRKREAAHENLAAIAEALTGGSLQKALGADIGQASGATAAPARAPRAAGGAASGSYGG